MHLDPEKVNALPDDAVAGKDVLNILFPGKSAMWFWRQQKAEKFPRPDLYIGNRPHWYMRTLRRAPEMLADKSPRDLAEVRAARKQHKNAAEAQ